MELIHVFLPRKHFFWALISPAWLLLEPVVSDTTTLLSLHLVNHEGALTNTKLQLADVQLCVCNYMCAAMCPWPGWESGREANSSWVKHTKPLSSGHLDFKGLCLWVWLQVQAIKSTEMRRLVFECSYVYASVRYKIWHNITQRKSSPRVGSFNGSKRESVSDSVMSEALWPHEL